MKRLGPAVLLLAGAVTRSGAAQAPATDAAQQYTRLCASCHGATGVPVPAMVRSLGAIPDLSDAGAMRAQPDSTLEHAITAGKGRMPAYRTRMTPEQIRAMVAYVRTLGRSS
jgi:mono/diheme cytochrome c family protein